MPRAPLPIETWGKITRGSTPAGTPSAVAYYRDVDGKRRRLLRTGATPAKAEAALREALRDRLAPADDYITARTTLTDLATAWLEELPKLKRSVGTITRYRSVVNSRLNAHLGEVRVQEATVPRLQRIISLVEEDAGPAQARMLGIVLTGMLGLAVRNGAIRDNPGEHLLLPVSEHKVVRAPTEGELAVLYARLEEFDNAKSTRSDAIRDLTDIADMMLATGARIGEVLALTWEDFNVEQWTVTIRTTLVAVPGKGLERSAPKSETSVRTLLLPEFVRPMLSRRKLSALVTWVFPSANGGPRWPENIRAQWNLAVAGSEVEWMTPHDLRKAVGTALGVAAAKEQLGHAGETVTRRHYVEKDILRPDQTEVLARFAGLKSNESSQ